MLRRYYSSVIIVQLITKAVVYLNFLCLSPTPKFRSYFGEKHGKGLADGVIGGAKNALEQAVNSCNENLLKNQYEAYVFLKEKFQVDYDEDECPHFIQKFFYVPKETINSGSKECHLSH